MPERGKSPKDLRGQPVGVTAPGSATDLLTGCMRSKDGVRPKEMKIISVGTNTIIPAIENDQGVDAMGEDPRAAHLVKRRKAYLPVDLRMEKATRETVMSMLRAFKAIGQSSTAYEDEFR